MNKKTNIFPTITVIMVLMVFAMILNITYNLREFGLNSAKVKAELVAQNVQNAINSHMLYGTINKSDFYIKQTKKLENIDNIWIVRAQSVVDQYGYGANSAKDNIDKEALKTGNTVELLNEKLIGHSTYRITMPFKAVNTQDINCLSCHTGKVGDTLGVISMDMSIDDLKLISVEIIVITAIIAFSLMLIILYLVRKLMLPYISIFDSIKIVMQRSNKGDFSGRITGIQTGEAKEVAHWVNEHMSRLQNSLISIEDQIDIFLTAHKSDSVVDPIADVQITVERLADIYKFRKTIERDEHIEEIYKRLAVILEERFEIDNFNFLEADTTNKSIEVVYINKELLCDPLAEGCRADRTNTLVDSCQFKNVCDKFTSDKHYLCMPYSISNDLDFIISMVFESEEDLDKVRESLPLIQDYVDSAKPEMVSKKLMQMLERTAQTDALTGLYNRKFLEKFLNSSLYEGVHKNVQCGVMMVDIDFFKLINDNYGHDVGDLAIKIIANTLTDVVSPNDRVIRFGGEEFIVIIINCDEEKVIKIAEEIRIAFSQQQIQAPNEVFTKTVSIGVSVFPNKTDDFWKYVKQSDIALYEAKQTGRDRVIAYKKELED